MGLGLILGGAAVLNYMGQREQSEAQARAEEQNARFFEEQAQFIEHAGRREENIFDTQSEQIFGSAMSSIARAGVDFSGAAAQALSGMQTQIKLERQALRDQVKFNASLARMRGANAQANADFLSSSRLQSLQALSSMFNAGASIASIQPASKASGDGGFGSLATGKSGSATDQAYNFDGSYRTSNFGSGMFYFDR